MTAGDALSQMLQATAASSAGALLVIAVRRLIRRAFGARAGYWLWLCVPATAVVVLLPQATVAPSLAPGQLSSQVHAAVSAALDSARIAAPPANLAIPILVAWALGALLSFVLIMRRHQAFLMSLGDLHLHADGSLRGRRCKEPMLLGVLRPRVVLPEHFEEAFGPTERTVVLAHEQAHLRRHDSRINALAAVWLCLAWFNPVMHWALRLFRFDQELACDATVLGLPGATRKGYAETLLKSQLTADFTPAHTLMGCHWHSFHPLTERIHMLKNPLPGALRRRAGIAITLGCVLGASYVVRAAQSTVTPMALDGRMIAVNMQVYINGAAVFAPHGARSGWDVLVSSGGTFAVGDRDRRASCIASLPTPGSQSSGEDLGNSIILSCRLSHANDVFATPTVVVRDGESASIAVTDPTQGVDYRLEFNASTAPARLAAAAAARAQQPASGVKGFQLSHSGSGPETSIGVVPAAVSGPDSDGVTHFQLQRK